MPRPRRWRHVQREADYNYFKPRGVPMNELDEIILHVEELEAIRMKDFQDMEQKQAAEKMKVSQPTFHRILKQARNKISDALINGKAIRIEGGKYKMAEKPTKKDYSKILITAKDKTLDSDIDPRFGRCKYFILYENEDFEVIENKGNKEQHGAGIKAAEQAINLKPDIIITGRLGPNSSSVLAQTGIQIHSSEGNIRKAIKELVGE